MTPREFKTLQTILHHVTNYNQRPIVAVQHRPLVVLTNYGKVSEGDIAIDSVLFAPAPRKSA